MKERFAITIKWIDRYQPVSDLSYPLDESCYNLLTGLDDHNRYPKAVADLNAAAHPLCSIARSMSMMFLFWWFCDGNVASWMVLVMVSLKQNASKLLVLELPSNCSLSLQLRGVNLCFLSEFSPSQKGVVIPPFIGGTMNHISYTHCGEAMDSFTRRFTGSHRFSH